MNITSKTISRIAAIAILLLTVATAQAKVLISESFDDYNVGNHLATEAIAQGKHFWTTWSDTPGSNEDATIADYDGQRCALYTYGNDQVLLLGDRDTGTYDLEFDMLVPDGKNGYFSLLHNFNGDASSWGLQCYLHLKNDGQHQTSNPGHGTVHAGSNSTADIPCVYDKWMHFRIHIDTDNDVADLYYTAPGKKEEPLCSWQWSLDSFGNEVVGRNIAALDFFPPQNAATSEFYVDNITFKTAHTPTEGEIVWEPFDGYTVGKHLASDAINHGKHFWTTWSDSPGSNEDATIADYDGDNCAHFVYGNDQVLLLGDRDASVYDLEFDMLVPDGKNGFFSLLHDFNADASTWGLQCYLHLKHDGQFQTSNPGHGTVHAGSNNTADIPCVYDEWMHFRIHIDNDYDVADLYYTAPGKKEEPICSWQWSLDSYGNNVVGRNIAALDFYPPQDAATSEFYVDNINFKRIGEESITQLNIDPTAVEVNLTPDKATSVAINIENEGRAIGNWVGWLDFGKGDDNMDGTYIAYYNGECKQGIGSSSANTYEMAIRLPASAYAETAMGKRLFSVNYFVNEDYQSADHNYIFRIYGQGINNQPGELLAEQTISSTTSNGWLVAVFNDPIYLTGQTLWATVEIKQAARENPLSMDDGKYEEESDGNWLSTNGKDFVHCYNRGEVEGAWMIDVYCIGQNIPATWGAIDKEEGTIMGGESETITLSLNSHNMSEEGEYHANLIIYTNDYNLPRLEIPVTLNVVIYNGDVNRDGIVDVADIATIINVMATTVPSALPSVNADVNKDGIVDVADIATVISIMAQQ